MKSGLNWRYVVIAAIVVIGVSGIIEALPHAKESPRDLAIDAGILALIVALSALFANIRATLIKRRKPRA